ncbi:hypothetical protein CWB41_15080 [Methylovirgula ligni]|uniref:DUF937 domain-containing protein n=1 Tax=Methylovirgula ligni TaxID=569860 RepID=A0A3D9YZH6_9HYPH|nr:DUF937 domain-containing protein [Methylovirgula ligni]QAY96891.1 hypothetical protein CWB41_15080 [Methylovirgula ligni]REF88057.1 hypothetical protein DES32_1698 [Methylovirgula ligni]
MFNLSDILQSAQGGQAIDNIAQRFGLSPEQAQAAVQALIPAISAGLTKAATNPSTLGSVISAATDSAHQASFNNTSATPSPDATQKSSDTLSQILGSNHIVQQIVERASAATGIRPDVLLQILPVVASLAIGGLAASLRNQGLSGALGQLASAAEQGNLGSILGGATGSASGTSASSGGGLLGTLTNILSSFLGGGGAGNAPAGAAPANSSLGSALSSLTSMFQTGNLPANISQSGLQDEIGKILNSNR